MKKSLYIIAALAFAVIGCSKEQNDINEEVIGQEGTMVSFKATIEAPVDVETRASISTADGTFGWNDGDKIAIQLSNDNFKEFEYSAASGEFSASLGVGETIKDGGVAYYPSTIAINGTPGSVSLPATYTAADAAKGFPMMASVDLGATTLSFTHLGGLLTLTASYVPADATKLVLTVPSVGVTGSFAVSTDHISASASASTVTLTFAAGAYGTSSTEFFIPVPVTTFSAGFTMEFKNASNETLFTKSTSKTTIAVARAAMKRMTSFTVPTYIYVQVSSWSATGENFVDWSNVYVHAYTTKTYGGKTTFYDWKNAATLMTGSTYTHNAKSYYRMEVPSDFVSADDVKLIFHDGSGDDYNRYNYNTLFAANTDTFFTLKEDTTGPYKLYFVNETSTTTGSDDANVKTDENIWVYVYDVTLDSPISPITSWSDKPNLKGMTYENLHDDVWIPYFEVPKGTNLGLIVVGKEQTQNLTSYDTNVSRKHVFYLKKLYKDGYHDIYHGTRPSLTVTKD